MNSRWNVALGLPSKEVYYGLHFFRRVLYQ
jgi:hypothetical protein